MDAKKVKRVLAALLAAAMLVGLAGCSEPGPEGSSAEVTQPEATQGGESYKEKYAEYFGGDFVLSWYTAATSLNPFSGVETYVWATSVFEPVLTKDSKNQIAPCVCDYELSEDNLTLKLTVRENKYFSDGSKVTGEDVWQSIMCSRSPYIQDNVIINAAKLVLLPR